MTSTEIHYYEIVFTDVDAPGESLFEVPNGRRKRQSNSYMPYTGPTFEELNFTDAQRALCNNIRTCLFDLAITGSEEVAGVSRQVSENTIDLQNRLGKYNRLHTCQVKGLVIG